MSSTSDEFAAFRHIERGGFDERIAAASRLKEEGNTLLNTGDFEDALAKYVEGLYHLEWHPRALAMVGESLPQDQIDAVRVPLLLNSTLSESLPSSVMGNVIM